MSTTVLHGRWKVPPIKGIAMKTRFSVDIMEIIITIPGDVSVHKLDRKGTESEHE